jgi:hypothetical protein
MCEWLVYSPDSVVFLSDPSLPGPKNMRPPRNNMHANREI